MTSTEQLDPFCAAAAGRRQGVYRALASEAVMRRITLPGGRPVWLVTGHAQVRRALTDSRLVKVLSPIHDCIEQAAPDLAPALITHMLRYDGPDHTRLRKMISAVFTRHQVEMLAPRIHGIAEDLLDAMEAAVEAGGGGEVDLIPSFAYPLPMTVICELVGVPSADRDTLRAWTETIVTAQFAQPVALREAVTGFVGYLRELIARKRRAPGEDLLCALIAVRDGGDRLSEDELTSMVWILILAGHETTVNLISNGTLALLTNPDQLARLRARPELMAGAVEELLRFDSPVQLAVPMVATEPLQIAGTAVARGEIVAAALLPANRDPAQFDEPNTLDIARPHNYHVAFGHGAHHCVGAPLARLEGRIALNALLARFPELRLALPPEQITRPANPSLNGLAGLPVLLR